MPTPQNKQDVRRLLSMVNYLQKFSPNLSDATSDLRNLLQEDVLFHWDPHVHGESLNRVKQLLTTAPLLKFLNPKEEVKLQTEEACGELPSQHQTTTRTIKLEPEWSRRYLEEQQLQDTTLKNFIQMKKSSKERPVWEDILSEGPVLKTPWTQWDRMEVRNGVLYRR